MNDISEVPKMKFSLLVSMMAAISVSWFFALPVADAQSNRARLITTPVGYCRDQGINKAFAHVTGRAPRGSGESGECNPRLYGNGKWSSYEDLQNKIAARVTNKGVAYVFVNPNLAAMQGHIAWAYMLDDGTYAHGETMAPGGRLTIPAGRDTNSPRRDKAHTEREMLDYLRDTGYHYTEYKRTFVMRRNARAAEAKAEEIRDWGYGLYGNNCLDHTYAVLEAYGVDKSRVMPWKEFRPAPNSWFRAFKHMNPSGIAEGGDDWPGARL